jgi:hypothetical protein
MVSQSDQLVTLDPRDEGVPNADVLAKRPPTLDGKVIGLLSNQKPHADELLRMIADVIGERYAIKGVVEISKASHQWPAGPEILKEMAEQCDVMIHATAE